MVSGFAAGLFGIGGGVILVPTFLVLFPRFGAGPTIVMHCAVGTCLALVVPAAIMSTRKQRALGNIDSRMLRTWLPWVALGTFAGVFTIQLLHTLSWPIGRMVRAELRGTRCYVVCALRELQTNLVGDVV